MEIYWEHQLGSKDVFEMLRVGIQEPGLPVQQHTPSLFEKPRLAPRNGDNYLEDHSRTRKWLITMVSPLRIGLFPFQMAFSWLINEGDPNHLLYNWDDPPSTLSFVVFLAASWASLEQFSASFDVEETGCKKLHREACLFCLGVCINARFSNNS